jgi:hypothetical protein
MLVILTNSFAFKTNEIMKEEVAKVSLYSNTLMIVTSIHHVYGAIVYHTPWRLQVLMVSIPVIIFTLFGSNFLIRREFPGKNLLLLFYWFITLIFSVILIGGYEGVYNHALKIFFSFWAQVKVSLARCPAANVCYAKQFFV